MELIEKMTNREIVLQYSEIIEACSDIVRKQLSECDAEGELSEDEKLFMCENVFFDSDLLDDVKICDVRAVIQNIYRRIRSKYGILEDLLCDDSVNEIMVNGSSNIFAERNRCIVKVDDAFVSEAELEEAIRMLAADVHREINNAHPIVDARLPSGYRVNGVLSAVALNGPILTIRKFSDRDIDAEILIENGSVTRECMDELMDYVRSGYNLFISGGTSSGKTTFLNALAMAIDKSERVIVIEDSAELKIRGIENRVHMECRESNSAGRGEVTMQQLIKTSLRMRPDRIIVGEVRGREVVDMIQAMNTGHDGSMSTGHGNSIKGMLNRLETMYLMDAQIPIYSIKNQIASAIDILIHLQRDAMSRRAVVEVAELAGFDGEDYELNYLYVTDESGMLVKTGNKLIDDKRLKRFSANMEVSDDRLQ